MDETIETTSLLFPIKVIAIDPKTTTTLYIGTLGGGIFKSTDGGTTWVKAEGGLTDPLVKAIAIDPVFTDRLYAGTENGGVFSSSDAGITWFPSGSLTDQDVTSLAVDPNSCQALPSCDTIYAGTLRGGVFKTTNRGGTWSDVNTTALTDLSVTAMALFPTDVDTIHLFVTTENGRVFKSTDGGASWIPALQNPPSLEIFSIVTTVRDQNTLYLGLTAAGGGYRSNDGGVTWQKMSRLRPQIDETVIVIDPQNPLILYASSLDGISRSADRGDSWSPFNAFNGGQLSDEVNDIYSLAIAPNRTAADPILYAGTFISGRLFKYENSWRELSVQ